jgi:hypothetical protein
MLHFSCDICGKEMVPGSSRRFVVKMEVYAAHDPTEITEEDLDLDHLEAISELLNEEALHGPTELVPSNKNFRYDLCPDCHQRFINDPLNREALAKFDFSPN